MRAVHTELSTTDGTSLSLSCVADVMGTSLSRRALRTRWAAPHFHRPWSPTMQK